MGRTLKRQWPLCCCKTVEQGAICTQTWPLQTQEPWSGDFTDIPNQWIWPSRFPVGAARYAIGDWSDTEITRTSTSITSSDPGISRAYNHPIVLTRPVDFFDGPQSYMQIGFDFLWHEAPGEESSYFLTCPLFAIGVGFNGLTPGVRITWSSAGGFRYNQPFSASPMSGWTDNTWHRMEARAARIEDSTQYHSEFWIDGVSQATYGPYEYVASGYCAFQFLLLGWTVFAGDVGLRNFTNYGHFSAVK